VSESGNLFVWGAGIYGEFKKPRQIKLANDLKISRIDVGGSFTVMVDEVGKILVWGANANGEIGVGDSEVRRHPTILETIEDKEVDFVSAGSCFAFAIGRPTNRVESTVLDDTLAQQQFDLNSTAEKDDKSPEGQGKLEY